MKPPECDSFGHSDITDEVLPSENCSKTKQQSTVCAERLISTSQKQAENSGWCVKDDNFKNDFLGQRLILCDVYALKQWPVTQIIKENEKIIFSSLF